MRSVLKHLSTSQIIIFGFAGVILLGSLLLMLPLSARSGRAASFADALFTATSAVCVTGLVVHDTATFWSIPGQMIILGLIQIGGMGVVTIALAIYTASGKKISLKQRSTMQEAISAPNIGGILRLTMFVIKMILLMEMLGTILLAVVFCKDFGLPKGLWYALFHSVSAFCNAGFDLMGVKTPYSSLTSYAGHPLLNLTITSLIIIGGIGFMTWNDIRIHRIRVKRYHMQSKVILVTTFFLILVPMLYFYNVECRGLSGGERFWAAYFQAVTPRTAGFNTINLSAVSDTGLLIFIVLMLTGGSPGSTAGGLKTTTFAVLLSTMIAVFFRRDQTQLFGRRIPEETVRNAVGIFMMYLILFLSGAVVISRLEGIPLLACLFETASALGTVGLTTGITPGLSVYSRFILILLMYIGRVGGLTLVYSAVSSRRVSLKRLPEEKITVG